VNTGVSTNASHYFVCPMCKYAYESNKVHKCFITIERDIVSELKQQILDAEEVIKELTLSEFAQGEIAKKYWEKYGKNNKQSN
jgi:hypothetical protein